MLLKSILLFFVLIVSYNYGYTQAKKKKSKSKIIVIDAQSDVIQNVDELRHIKVGDYVQVQLLNNPFGQKYRATVHYSNRNLELGNKFATIIPFEYKDTSETRTQEVIQKEPQGYPASDTADNKNEFQMFNYTQSENNALNNNTDLKYKLNENNMRSALEINTAKQFIERNSNLSGAKEAANDIAWQQNQLIVWLQNNFTRRLAYKDSLIDTYAKFVYATTVKNFQSFTVDDYDKMTVVIERADSTGKNGKVIQLPSISLKKGFKIDFSAGLMYNNLLDQKYTAQYYNLIDSSKVQLIDISPSKKSVGVSLLAHGYPRLTSRFNIALTSGFMYQVNQEKLNYVFGLSTLLGAEQRFVVTFAGIIGKQSQLSPIYNFKEGVTYSPSAVAPNVEVQYINQTVLKFGVGISYNLGFNRTSSTEVVY